MSEIQLKEKWIEADFVELNYNVNEETGKRKIILKCRIIPFGIISRNRTLYEKQSVIDTCSQLIGLNLHHNHITDGADTYPKGCWFDAWTEEDGMYGKAEVYDTKYNEEYIEWLMNAKNIKVSLQASGKAKSKKDENGSFREAQITNWKEASTVNIPGFMEAGASFEIMAEKLCTEQVEEENKNNLVEKIVNLIDTKL